LSANIGIDAKPASRHEGILGNAMLGKDTVVAEENDLWGQPVGEVGQGRAL